MKGLSVVFTLVLLLLAHYLAERLRRADALPRHGQENSNLTVVTPASANDPGGRSGDLVMQL